MSSRLFKFVVVVTLVAVVLGAGRTLLVRGQDSPGITVNLTPYEGNPILTVGEEGAWDSGTVNLPRVIYKDGVFHMFYTGHTPVGSHIIPAIGYATSEDGINWTKYEGNPVFVPDESIALYGVLAQWTMLDGETWVMYFNPIVGPNLPSATILRATAPSPTGPWTIDPEPVLAAGTVTDWDWKSLSVDTVLRIDDEYVLYYTPVTGMIISGQYGVYLTPGPGIGRAVSSDGIHWTKYDDPATTSTHFATSDPVFVKNPDYRAWDGYLVGGPVVRFSVDGWEMFYYGGDGGYWRTGYATSEDGISWTRYGDAPVVINEAGGGGPGSVLVIDDTYYLYHSFITAGSPTIEIGVVIGTITRE